MNEIRFSLNLSAERYLAFYQGAAQQVSVRAHDGRRLQFPASVLRPFVGHDGVHGEFAIQFDAANKFQGIRRV